MFFKDNCGPRINAWYVMFNSWYNSSSNIIVTIICVFVRIFLSPSHIVAHYVGSCCTCNNDPHQALLCLKYWCNGKRLHNIYTNNTNNMNYYCIRQSNFTVTKLNQKIIILKRTSGGQNWISASFALVWVLYLISW